MPLTSPAFPPGPYRFVDREYLIITYRTDKAALEAVVPEPLTFDEPIVKYEFIRMPNSTGFGDYTESGQVIPVRYKGIEGGYTHVLREVEHSHAGFRPLAGLPCGIIERLLDVVAAALPVLVDGVAREFVIVRLRGVGGTPVNEVDDRDGGVATQRRQKMPVDAGLDFVGQCIFKPANGTAHRLQAACDIGIETCAA
jgi:hypothetical protein